MNLPGSLNMNSDEQFFSRLSTMLELYYERLESEFYTRMTACEGRVDGLVEAVKKVTKEEEKVALWVAWHVF